MTSRDATKANNVIGGEEVSSSRTKNSFHFTCFDIMTEVRNPEKGKNQEEPEISVAPNEQHE